MNKQPAYTFSRFRNAWRVWRMTYHDNGNSGTGVSDHPTAEEARREVYRLNGWKWKEQEASHLKEVRN